MGKELRCPNCNRPVPPESLAYSSSLGQFVCPACKASAAAKSSAMGPAMPGEAPVTRVPVPPPPSFLDHPLPDSPAAAPKAPPVSSVPPLRAQPVAAAPDWHRSPIVFAAGLILLAALVTAVAIFFFARTAPRPDDAQRAWDQAHHDEIIALKSQAESLAIGGKLAEAHAKYREIEKLIGGRQVKEPTLFDMVEVSRQDQDRIYKLLLAKMEQAQRAATQPARTDLSPRPPIAPLIGAPQQAYPRSFDALRTEPAPATRAQGDLDEAMLPEPPSRKVPVVAPPPPATAVAATTPASTRPDTDTEMPAGAQQFIDYPRGPVSDPQVGEAIHRGVDFLLSRFQDGELRLDDKMTEARMQGLDALAVYALAVSSKAIVDQRISPKGPEMNRMLEKLKSYKLESGGDPRSPLTYARSLRACALATFNRPQDRATLEDDVDWLINDSTAGAYTYDDRFSPARAPRKQKRTPATMRNAPRAALSDAPVNVARATDEVSARIILTDGVFTPRPPVAPVMPPPRIFTNRLPPRSQQSTPNGPYKTEFPWDNSNSQYGLLGVWAGAEVGCEVPDNFWRLVQRHWESCQLPSGQWNYAGDDRGGTFSMTVAGVASLLVTHDYLEAPLLNTRTISTRPPYSAALSAGLAWLEDGDDCVNVMDQGMFYVGYNLFGIERVGLASGFKQFGGHDWFVELAARTIPTQWPSGAYGRDGDGFDAIVDTSYMLLFLSRGRHPIMANKLRYDGQWTNRPREIANLTAYTAREMERPLNWQVVDITREPSDWADAPILYISGNKPIDFKPEDLAKLGDFVDNGGIIFTHADLGKEEFNKFAVELSKKLFPLYGPLRDLPADHPVYKLNYTIATPRPRLQGVSNGVRLLMVHSPADLSNAWQVRASLSRKEAFQLGANLYLYATGKEKFRNRLDTPVVPAPTEAPLRTLALARLKYTGNWNPEPGAWPRFARILQWQTGVKLDVKETAVEQLQFDQTPIAHLTGTDVFTPTDAQLAALKRFVESGGTLLIDAAGGSGPFADAEASWLSKILGDAKLQPLPPTDPLLKHTIDGTVDVPAKALRLFAIEQLGNDASRLKSAKVGRGKVVFSALDVCSGLLGTNTWGILGYLPEYSEAVAKNLVLTGDGQK